MTGALCRNFYSICWVEIVAIFWLLWHQIVCLITHVYGYDVQTIFVHFWPFMSFCENDEICVCVLYPMEEWMRKNKRKQARMTEIKWERVKNERAGSREPKRQRNGLTKIGNVASSAFGVLNLPSFWGRLLCDEWSAISSMWSTITEIIRNRNIVRRCL